MEFLGIDVSKKTLDVCLLKDGIKGKKKHKTFANDENIIRSLTDWLLKQKSSPDRLTVVMEATGIYHENLAFGLHDCATFLVCLANPQRVREFARGMGILTKNDKVDAFVLAAWGVLKQPDAWVPPPPEIRKLRALLRRRDALKEDVQRTENRLEKALSTQTPVEVMASLTRTLKWLKGELARVERLIKNHTDGHPGLKKKLELLTSIKGISGETGHEMLAILGAGTFRSGEQAAAYLGVVPVECVSGSSVRGRSRMSKAGPPAVRAKLYMAALSAMRWNAQAKALYDRLVASGKAKKSALGAVMRKLVHQCFGVLKTGQPWSAEYGLMH